MMKNNIEIKDNIKNDVLVIFANEGEECFKITKNGDIFIHGKKCGNDEEVLQGIFKLFKIEKIQDQF